MGIHDFIMAMLSLMVAPLVARAEWLYRRMPNLTPQQGERPLPAISIIVPARNEAVNLHRLLPSLQAQAYNGPMELWVVDDNSTDHTAVVAHYHGAQVINLTELPSGWLGKPNAVHQGVQHSSGEWLLFTDADMAFEPTAVASAVQYALDHNLDGLSLFPRQIPLGPIDRVALMVGFAGLFAGLRRDNHTLNGQFVLLRRDVYEASGGMTAVKQEMLEDLAFGVHLHSQGYQTPMMRGDEVAHVHMYESLPHMWRGMTRLGSGSLKYSGFGAVITALFIAGTLMPLLAPLFVATRLVHKRWLALTWLTAVPGFITWGRRFGGAGWALLAPFGALIVQMAALWGFAARYLGSGILWKNRSVK
jgi:cellulose synthase/poly-beta-1,6-N-acetylglucosamine synthase-like glycosyltransferase